MKSRSRQRKISYPKILLLWVFLAHLLPVYKLQIVLIDVRHAVGIHMLRDQTDLILNPEQFMIKGFQD